MSFEASHRADRVQLPRGSGVSPAILRVVLRRLADYANAAGICWPTAKALAGYRRDEHGCWHRDDADFDERTARDAVAVLVEIGLVRRLGRGPRGFRYRLAEKLASGSDTHTESGVDTRSSRAVNGGSRQYERVNRTERAGKSSDESIRNPLEPTSANPAESAFAGDLAAAVVALRSVGIAGSDTELARLARTAGSERAVAWFVEERGPAAAKARARNPAGLLVAAIRNGERPPSSWKSRAERRAEAESQRHQAEHDAATKRKRDAADVAECARVEAKQIALIEAYADVADQAVAAIIDDPEQALTGTMLARLAPAERRVARIVRIVRIDVLGAIDAVRGHDPDTYTDDSSTHRARFHPTCDSDYMKVAR